MNQLGFTFYPKDWWSSNTFYMLEPLERYIFLECIFLMYNEDGFMINDKTNVERRLRMSISEEVWDKIISLMEKHENKLTHKGVVRRMKRKVSNRKNGILGGAPKGNKNASKENNRKSTENQLKTTQKTIKSTQKQPKQNKSAKNKNDVTYCNSDEITNNAVIYSSEETTQNNPPLKKKYNIKEKERERENKINNKDGVSAISKKNDFLLSCFNQAKFFWLEEFHPGWSFNGVQGKALKSIIQKIKKNIEASGESALVENVVEMFKILCQHLPEWFKAKELNIIDSKYNEIIEQIKNQKNGTTNEERKFNPLVDSKYAKR